MYIILDTKTNMYFTEEEQSSVEAFLDDEINNNFRDMKDFEVYEVKEKLEFIVRVKMEK